jgi:hypothetical protein
MCYAETSTNEDASLRVQAVAFSEAMALSRNCNTLGVKHAFALHFMSTSIIYAFMVMSM